MLYKVFYFEPKLNIRQLCSTVRTEPVTSSLVSSEGLLSELLVSTVLDGVDFESVGVGVDEMVLGEEVGDGVHHADHTENHSALNLLIGTLSVTEIGDVFGDIVGHLGSRGRSSIIVLNHTVMELRRHSNNHMIVVGVEVTTLRYIKSERRRVMVTSQQVVRVVHDTGRVHGNLGQLWGPDTHVSSLSLMDSLIWGPHAVMDDSLSVIPFLEVIGSVLLMSGVNSGQEFHGSGELHLFETLVNKEIILLMHSSVASLARSGENLVSTSQTKRKNQWLILKR